MKLGDKIALGLLVLVLIVVAFFVGIAFQSYHCIGYLEDGRKFVDIKDSREKYILKEKVWVEKLPNGFYRAY